MKMAHVFLPILLLAPVMSAQTGSRAYVGRGYGTGIDIIDVDSMTKTGNIANAGGYRMVLSLDGKKLYSTAGNSMLYITDTEADTLLKAFNPSQGVFSSSELEGIAIHPDGSKVYVCDESTTSIFVIDTSADTVLAAGELSAYEPENAVMSPDGQSIFVNDNTWTSRFSTTTFEVLGFADTGNDGHGIAISTDGSKIYADGAGVIIIDSNTMTPIDTLGSADGYYLETSKDGTRVYGVNEGTILSVIDAQADTLIQNVTLSRGSARGVTTNLTGDIILIATSSGLLKLNASDFSETGSVIGSWYQSVIILEPDGAIPVELSSFSATVTENQVHLEWQTQTETNNFGFEVERSDFSGWRKIGFVQGKGTTQQPQHYAFVDELSKELLSSSKLEYRLKQIDLDGAYEYSSPITVQPPLPVTAHLTQNYPNPFNPTTTVSYSIAHEGFVSLKLYDILGKEAATLVSQRQQAGGHAVNFEAGKHASGIYFYNLYLGGQLVDTKKMMLLR